MINMKKKIAIAAFLMVASVPVYAQRDIKTLNNKTSSQIISLIGEPADMELGEDYENEDKLFYDDSVIIVDNENKSLVYFETSSSTYCILSDLIPGGIKVGVPFSKIQSFDFANTEYGRGKEANGLHNDTDISICDQDSDYIVFDGEYEKIGFVVKNGRIAAWAYMTAPDYPYPDYDDTNSLL